MWKSVRNTINKQYLLNYLLTGDTNPKGARDDIFQMTTCSMFRRNQDDANK